MNTPRRRRRAASALSPCLVSLLGLAASTLLAACGGTGSPGIASATSGGTSSGTTATPTESQADQVKAYLAQARAFAACARTHGMPDTSDPDQYGNVTQHNHGDAARTEVWEACQKGVTQLPKPSSLVAAQVEAQAASLTPAQVTMEEKWVTCMHANGAPDVPDFNPQDPNNELPADEAAEHTWEDEQPTPTVRRAMKTCKPIRDSYFGTP